jgi:hypothetical protein
MEEEKLEKAERIKASISVNMRSKGTEKAKLEGKID